MKKKILFLSGTRADYGKMKPLMQAVEDSEQLELFVFVCGMHLLEQFGSTYKEIVKDGYRNIYVAYGLNYTNDMSVSVANTIQILSGYVQNINPDMIIVHGDRMDALAGAVVGALHNKVVAHIEGGELSGTIDESIRHAISKFAHVHFVCNDEAKKRLLQLGEEERRIFIIGSPDIDVMLSSHLPSLEKCKERYDIPFDNYSIVMYHPVTTEYNIVGKNTKELVDALLNSDKNYILVYPNSDLGSEVILNEYKRLEGKKNIKIYPSLRFEFFLTLLKNADMIIGNSSAGIREAGVYGIPVIDIGSRQKGRYSLKSSINIQHVNENKEEILNAIDFANNHRHIVFLFGKGDSTKLFMDALDDEQLWQMEIQKHFVDCDF